jgi:hypothetical protein
MWLKQKDVEAITRALCMARDVIPPEMVWNYGRVVLDQTITWEQLFNDAMDVTGRYYLERLEYNKKQRVAMAKRRQDPEIRAKHNKASRDYYRRKKKIVG